MTRLCVAALVICNTFSCSGITGGVQLEGGALFFNPSPIAAQIKTLRTVMVFTVAVGVAKTINLRLHNYPVHMPNLSGL